MKEISGHSTTQKMNSPIKDFFSKCVQIPMKGHIFQQTCSWKLYYLSIYDRLVQVRSYLLKISLMENSIFWTDDKSVEAATCGSSTGKRLCQSPSFNKVTGFLNKVATLLKKKLCNRCFPVNFVKFLRTPFSQSTFGRLILKVVSILMYSYHIRNKIPSSPVFHIVMVKRKILHYIMVFIQ